ncbi:hypothetical protein KKI19_02640 [Patescibacteria group bacterium]|nr:hypothetical protein [Patescibacteria group bacterium]
MRKQIKISLFLLGGAVLSSILHNAVYGLFGVEEPVFFSLILLLALAFVVSIGYNFFTFLQKKRPGK